ncbi:hypothetical protein [Hymenobacter rigui]|uniref:Uncharacterized protein n=1 Tax=Hymenobacter rigui TaxID=334424 RepID=A0A428KNL1_9BACT|nr:hypothetical protein [Hymenobacter rigui]RSK48035.1 hypothetical protein EI291_13165 [Hymenobacter rigui]
MTNYWKWLAGYGAGGLLLMACEQRPATHTERAARQPADTLATAADKAAEPPVVPSDTTDASRTGYSLLQAGHDTVFRVGRRQYRLLLRAATDSTKPLLAVTTGAVGSFFAADTATFARTRQVRGYEGWHTITLLDSAGRTVFRQRLRKADFFGVADPDVVTVSEPQAPRLVGAHGPSQRLALALEIGIPYSDVSQRVVVLLRLDGSGRQLFNSYRSNWGAPDCVPRLLADGTLLTCQALVPPSGPLVSLQKPRAELVAAFPLTDTTLFTVYRYGYYRPAPPAAPSPATAESLPIEGAAPSAEFQEADQWVEDGSRRRSPNAFIITPGGQVQQPLRYTGTEGTMAYEVPRRYVWQTHTYYLLDEKRGLLAIDKHRPGTAATLPFRQMEAFRRPRRPAEIRFELRGLNARYAFYLDPQQPRQLQLEQLPAPE